MANAKVFISHSSKDRKIARTICTALENHGVKCWIATRDVGPGENFQEAIVRAIRATKVMVLVFTENANNSGEIKKELALASRYNLVVIPARVENVVPSDAFELEFATRQWVDLFEDWEAEIQRLVAWIAGIVAAEAPAKPVAPPQASPPAPLPAPPHPEVEQAPKPEVLRAVPEPAARVDQEKPAPPADAPRGAPPSPVAPPVAAPSKPPPPPGVEPVLKPAARPAPAAAPVVRPAPPPSPQSGAPAPAGTAMQAHDVKEPIKPTEREPPKLEPEPEPAKPGPLRLVALLIGLALLCVIGFVAAQSTLVPTAPALSGNLPLPPPCDGAARPPVLTACTPNSGDTAWMLAAVGLVLMMTVPGLGLFYGGMVRRKNVGNTVMTTFATTCLVAVLFAVLTYSLAFREGGVFVGGLDRAFLRGMLNAVASGVGNPNPLAPTVPEAVFLSFQMMFAIITPALIAGAFVERMKFSAMLWFVGLWAIFVYAPVAHWVWGPDGFLNSANDGAWLHVLDFAGGTVVHLNAGVAGLMCALMLGKRHDAGPPHNVVLTFVGAALLWVGWFGFNAGSAVAANVQTGMAMLVTQLGAAVAGLAWMLLEWRHRGMPTLLGICSGAVAGLVAITPAAGFVGPIGAMLIGLAAGVLCYFAVVALKARLGYDDALDCFGIHGVGGIVGALLTGVLAVEQYGGTAGVLEGNVGQAVNQIVGVVIVAVYGAVVSLILLALIKLVIGLRVPKAVERDGLDLALHGETVQ